ncbi:hypothetical protein ABT112_30115 [Streptomyces sp. NPDC002055]|uniref:hypothetical protein n=1 Tax=Streptomyces sp. NPDC002055 TaxID=3154534 RepID=UPI003323DB46
MTWWFKARRGHTVLPLALAGFLVFAIAARNTSVVLPSLLNGSGQVVLMTFTPVPVAAGLMASLSSRLDAAEVSGVRPVALLDAALAAGVTAVAVLITCAAGAVLGQSDIVAAGRNTTFLVGLMLCVRPFAGPPAVMAPVGWLMLAVLIGVRPGGDPYPWTVVREPLDATHAAVIAVVVFSMGIVATYFPTRKT